jgi:hypothetical protein
VTGYSPRVRARLAMADFVSAPVSYAEAQTVRCPKCGAGKRRRCFYLADTWAGSRIPGRQGTLLHYKGQQMAGKVHDQRKQAVRLRRKADWLARNPVPRTSHAQAAQEAMRAWDVREHEQLRAWWAKHGHIFSEPPYRIRTEYTRHRFTDTVRSDLL